MQKISRGIWKLTSWRFRKCCGFLFYNFLNRFLNSSWHCVIYCFFVSVYLYKCICAMYLRSPLPFPGLLGVSIRGAKCHFRKNLSWSREESETHLTGDGFVKDLPPLCTSKSLPFTLASKWLWKSFLISFNISAEFWAVWRLWQWHLHNYKYTNKQIHKYINFSAEFGAVWRLWQWHCCPLHLLWQSHNCW